MNLLSKNTWEPIIGLWSVVHGLFGVIVALSFILYEGSLVSGLLITAVLAVGWEIIEILFDGHEKHINRIADIIVAIVVYLIVYYIYTIQNISLETVKLSLWVAIALFIVGTIIGWSAYFGYNKI